MTTDIWIWNTVWRMPDQENMSMWFKPSYTPLLYSEIGVYRGIHNFLFFALKHRLWVLVRTASEATKKGDSPAEIQDDLAIASIENIFVYSDRYGHSDLKSDWCQSGILGQFKMAAKIQDGHQKQGKLAEFLKWKIISLLDYILCQVDSLCNILYHFDHIKNSKWLPKSKMAAEKR